MRAQHGVLKKFALYADDFPQAAGHVSFRILDAGFVRNDKKREAVIFEKTNPAVFMYFFHIHSLLQLQITIRLRPVIDCMMI